MGLDLSLLLESFLMFLDPFLHDVPLDVESCLYCDASDYNEEIDRNGQACESYATLAHEVSSLRFWHQVSECKHVVLDEYDKDLIDMLHVHSLSLQIGLASIHSKDCHDRALKKNLELQP